MQAAVVAPAIAAAAARPLDLVLGRIDVKPTLDGVRPGLGRLRELAARGVQVVNGADTLLACHDKLATTTLLRAAGVPQPEGAYVAGAGEPLPDFGPPYVVKPRFGSWGRDVIRCESRRALTRTLRGLEERPWFRRHGALVQELVPPQGFDLRLVVSGGVVIGAVERVAAPGEWRTNIALGGHRRPAHPSAETYAIAMRAATAVGGNLVGVDLLPSADGWRVIEINGAVEFTDEYSLGGADVFGLAVEPFAGVHAVAAVAAL
jgi:RimK family alpha-L-glutamate ligase